MSETTYVKIDPKSVVINRTSRQRQENIADVDDLKRSIRSVGLLHPIIVRREGDEIVLVTGERRLTAHLQLDMSEIDARFFDTLTEIEAEEIELEENAKRKDLSWRDQVRATGRLHSLYKTRANNWRIEDTAERITIHPSYLRKILHVFEAINSGRIAKAENIDQAYNTLHRFAERKAESIVDSIIVAGANIFGDMPATASQPPITALPPQEDFTTVRAITVIDEPAKTPSAPVTSIVATIPPKYIPPAEPIITANFVEWIKTYNGPKFTLIHCDFPYGNYRGGDSKGAQSALETEEFYDNTESVYWTLLDALTANLDKIMSYSAHMLFWFNMNFYTRTVAELRKTGLMVHDHPIIWHKTGGPGGLGVVPGTAVTYPRRTYDTALLAVRGNRPLAKPGMNSYAAPTVGNKIHPSQKPEPMLRFFLQMLVDETTSVFDPTCGSGAALRAAEDLGAKAILGLELDPNYAADALTQTLKARILRTANGSRREEQI